MDINDRADGSTLLKTPTGTIRVPCKRDEVSDGYHTYKELDDHLDALFARLCSAYKDLSWKTTSLGNVGAKLAVLILRESNTEPPMGHYLPTSIWDKVGVRMLRVVPTSWTTKLEYNITYLLGCPMPAIKDTATLGTIHTPTETIGVPYSVGLVSDGEYSFNDLYALRHALFIALCHAHRDRQLSWQPAQAWKSLVHEDGTMFDDYFIAGIRLPEGMITYHLPIELWDILEVEELEAAPAWDGHTPQDVVDRLLQGL